MRPQQARRGRRAPRLLLIGVVGGMWATAVASAAALLQPHVRARIDYSAANEYVAAHYHHIHGDEPYFQSSGSTHNVYNARDGIVLDGEDDAAPAVRPATLARCGFELRRLPPLSPNVTDAAALRDYCEQLRTLVAETLEASPEHGKVAELILWHPVLRAQEEDSAGPRGAGGGSVCLLYTSPSPRDS